MSHYRIFFEDHWVDVPHKQHEPKVKKYSGRRMLPACYRPLQQKLKFRREQNAAIEYVNQNHPTVNIFRGPHGSLHVSQRMAFFETSEPTVDTEKKPGWFRRLLEFLDYTKV